MMKYEFYFFDLDGTITDSARGITNSVMYALKKYGIKEENREKLYAFIGPPLTDSFQKYYGFSKEQSWKAVEYYREYYKDQGIFECEVYEGIKSTLSTIQKNGKKAVIATSKPEIYTKRIVEHFQLNSYFDGVYGMELNGGRGTKSEVIQYALRECNIKDLNHVLMIGDRSHDMIGAKENGIQSLGVLYGFGSEKELKEAGADSIVHTTKELNEWIEKRGKS